MAIPMWGSVSVQGNQAVVVLEMAGGEVDRLLDQCHHYKHS